MNEKIKKYSKKLDIAYARYLKFKRADRYIAEDELSFAEKHSARVKKTKKFLTRMIFLLVILIIVWPLANKDWAGSKISFQNESQAENQTVKQENKNGFLDNSVDKKDELANMPVMMKPNFFGNDDNGQPYNINAISGVSVSEEKIILREINADMSLKDSSKIILKSENGDYSVKKKELALNGGVVIITDKGYEFKTNTAYIKLNENMATGSENVQIKGRLGDITASGFTIRNSGDEIALYGDVELIANLDDKEIEEFNKKQSEEK
jgi:hypothetical protein